MSYQLREGEGNEYPVMVHPEGRALYVANDWDGVVEALEDYYEGCSVDIEEVEKGCHLLYVKVDGWNVELFITPTNK